MPINNGKVDTFANRLKEAMQLRSFKAVDLVEMTGIKKQQISQYVNGKFEAKQRALYLLAKALDVSEAWLMGYDVPINIANKKDEQNKLPAINKDDEQLINMFKQLNSQDQDYILKFMRTLADSHKND